MTLRVGGLTGPRRAPPAPRAATAAPRVRQGEDGELLVALKTWSVFTCRSEWNFSIKKMPSLGGLDDGFMRGGGEWTAGGC